MLTVVFIGNIMLTVMCKWTQMLTLVQTGKSVLALMFTRIHVSTYGEIRSDADVFADPFANPGKFHADFDVHVDSYAECDVNRDSHADYSVYFVRTYMLTVIYKLTHMVTLMYTWPHMLTHIYTCMYTLSRMQVKLLTIFTNTLISTFTRIHYGVYLHLHSKTQRDFFFYVYINIQRCTHVFTYAH